MTAAWIEAFVRIFTTLGFIAGGVVSIVNFLRYLERKASERSVGATKVKEILELLNKMKLDLDDVKKETGGNSKAIDELQIDFRELMHQISVAFFGRK